MYNSNNRNDDRKEDKPPFSRVFVVCSKQTQSEDLKTPFEKYGDIEDLYMPKDRHTGEPKGVAYIKYFKTSSAAAAIQDLQVSSIRINNKPIKVMVASNKNDSSSNNEEKYKRLFIKVHKEVSEDEVYEDFSCFGHIDSIHLQKDKVTEKCKGFAYVQFSRFLDAAKAFEGCDKKYKPVFATPKDELKRSRYSLEGSFVNQTDNYNPGGKLLTKDNYYSDKVMLRDCNQHRRDNINLLSNVTPQDYTTVLVTCNPQISQKYIEKLFNIIPGMLQCQYSSDSYNDVCKALISYDNEKSATFAVERLNYFEFPSGEVVSVRPDDNPLNKAANNLNSIVKTFKNSIENGNPDLLQLADAIAQASSLIKAATTSKDEQSHLQENFCSVKLPSPKPMASPGSRMAQRCFIVCKPYPPPAATLKDAFCRFGDLIDVCTFPNKTFGFVKYASVKAAQDAINTLHGATLCGVYLKVLEADERPTKDDDIIMADMSDSSERVNERKRIRLQDDD